MSQTPQELATAQHSPAGRRQRGWWPTAAVFVAGVVMGVLGVGLLDFSTPDFAERAGASGGSAPSAPASVEVAARAEVNAACLRVINQAQDAYRILQGVGDAATQVDLERLDEIVRQLQPVEARLQVDLPGCEINTSLGEPASETPAEPNPVPSPTPTR